MKQPTPTYIGDTYRFHWQEAGTEMVIERLGENRNGQLMGELTVTSSRPGQNGHITGPRSFNLIGPNALSSMVKDLQGRLDDTGESDLNWRAMLEQLSYLTVQRYREGDPIVRLGEVEVGEGPRHLLRPFILDHGATVVFAHGGSAKSLLALAMGITVASGVPILGLRPERVVPVLYLDWEDDDQTHAERMRAICAGLDETIDWREIDLFYRPQVASLADSSQVLTRKIGELGVGLGIVDSIALAGNGNPEDADTKIRLFGAERGLHIPVLNVDHVSNTNKDKPFGSVYTHNAARVTWKQEVTQEDDENEITIALTHKKSNLGRKHARMGYRIRFENDSYDRLAAVRFEECDPKDLPPSSGSLTHAEHIVQILTANQGQPMPVQDLRTVMEIEGVDVSESVVRTTLARNAGKRFVKVGDSWALKATREEAPA